MKDWFEILRPDSLLTPALLFYPQRIARNIEKMIQIAGSPSRLRPHVKTHKCTEIVQMQLKKGICKFKCATLAESKMLAKAGAKDILVAYPLVGPAQILFLELCKTYANSRFSVLVDHEDQLELWDKKGEKISVFIDLNVGMNRTGIQMQEAAAFYKRVLHSSQTNFMGWHLYDGHIHDIAIADREGAVAEAFSGLEQLLNKTGTQDAEITCGGSITFPVHAKYAHRTLSPGTTLLWDEGYASVFPDLPFENAATVGTRVISKPAADTLCLDLGHKAVASEMKKDSVFFPQLPDAKILVHSEEHMVIKTNQAKNRHIGDILYGIPWHICPTVALHYQAAIVENQDLTGFWEIGARDRIYKL
ncbi:D-TA family PLP-dependent enzyme [Flavimarina sp. Hel_I_48]|uniref:D-TA family PLP-dependent enzyme n=1 Tax=Flavimarina sp. Hel_I_48 TaxID=1392488 RepID=UPI0004DFCB45|nr:D-TA family PLP-dependent enzyme [Flavimarina sp. Hel_I_48]